MSIIVENLPTDHGVYVYLFCFFGRENEPIGPVKIGITSNVAARLASVQTGAPRRLTAVAVFNVPNRDIARKWELGFHRIFTNSRLEGEWFSIDPIECLETMCSYISEHFRGMERIYWKQGESTAAEFIEEIGIPHYLREAKVFRCWREYYAENSNVQAIA
jgi:hypothetical protein